MANAQVLVLVRSSSPLVPGQIQSIIEAAARAAGFTPGPWTFDTQSARVVPSPGGGGSIVTGPWAGDTISETVPASGTNIVLNAYRQNLLNGPDPSPSIAHWPMDSAAAGQALRALPGVSSTRISFRAPGNVIAWDRGVPAPIALVATSAPTNFGPLLGILAVAGLAFAASRGSAPKPALGRVRSWERRAASVASRTRLGAAWWEGKSSFNPHFELEVQHKGRWAVIHRTHSIKEAAVNARNLKASGEIVRIREVVPGREARPIVKFS